jgi:hypothetical protein
MNPFEASLGELDHARRLAHNGSPASSSGVKPITMKFQLLIEFRLSTRTRTIAQRSAFLATLCSIRRLTLELRHKLGLCGAFGHFIYLALFLAFRLLSVSYGSLLGGRSANSTRRRAAKPRNYAQPHSRAKPWT